MCVGRASMPTARSSCWISDVATRASSRSVIDAALKAAESLSGYWRMLEGKKLPEFVAPAAFVPPPSFDPLASPAIPVLPPRVVAKRPCPAGTTIDPTLSDEPLALGQPDWLFNELTVEGPAHELVALRSAARGAGVIPWERDFDVLEEDLFLLLVERRDNEAALGPTSAHAVARRVRTLAEQADQRARQDRASARSVALDLQALLPVPADVLRLGPEHPQARGWLWSSWGTTRSLRRVAEPVETNTPVPRKPIEGDRWRVEFLSADWSPWPALQALAVAWPQLQFRLRPVHELL